MSAVQDHEEHPPSSDHAEPSRRRDHGEPSRMSVVPGQPEPPRIAPVPEPPLRMSAVPEPEQSPELVALPDPPAVDAPRIDSPHMEVPVRKDPPFSDSFSEPQERVDPPTMMTPAAGGLVSPGGVVGGTPDDTPRVEAVRKDPFTVEPQFEQERLPDEPPAEQPQSALREETRTDSRPSPRRREDKDEHPSRPRLAPANGGVDKHSQAFVDDILNTQERNLLKELQDELARREQQDPPPAGPWRGDRPGRHGKPFEHPNQTTGPMIINGVPPHPDKRGYPPSN